MAPHTSAEAKATEPDMSLLNDLFEEIATRPPAIPARKLLIDLLFQAGWLEAAYDATQELLTLNPHDAEAKALLALYPSSGSSQRDPPEPPPILKPVTRKAPPAITLPEDLSKGHDDLAKDYEALRTGAKSLLSDMRLLRDLHQRQNRTSSSSLDKYIPDLAALVDGRITSTVRVKQPGSARFVARAMAADPPRAVDICCNDLTDMARWLRLSSTDDDTVREALAKRVQALIAALPQELQCCASTALMHIEHEVLNKSYVCMETMIGSESISDVPRSNFLATQDGYAWDMEELAQAISSNSGIMRNPLSKDLFSPPDITAIVQHPLGKHLAAMQIEQSKLSQGVRPSTITQLDALSKTLLGDLSEDAIPSRKATEEFLAYLATLPGAEQNAIDKLRVPAKDSHTGLAFDSSVGEAVRDAAGNRLCFHKAGDFLRQAAAHLRQR